MWLHENGTICPYDVSCPCLMVIFHLMPIAVVRPIWPCCVWPCFVCISAVLGLEALNSPFVLFDHQKGPLRLSTLRKHLFFLIGQTCHASKAGESRPVLTTELALRPPPNFENISEFFSGRFSKLQFWSPPLGFDLSTRYCIFRGCPGMHLCS